MAGAGQGGRGSLTRRWKGTSDMEGIAHGLSSRRQSEVEGRRCSGTGVEGWSVLYSLSGWGELAVVRAYHRLKQRNTYDMPEYLRMPKVLMMHTNT